LIAALHGDRHSCGGSGTVIGADSPQGLAAPGKTAG